MYLGIYTREEKMCPQGAVFLQYSLESVVFEREAARKTIVFSTASKRTLYASFFAVRLFFTHSAIVCLTFFICSGFARWAFMPAARHFCASSVKGVCGHGDDRACVFASESVERANGSARQRSMPFITGIITSMRTASNVSGWIVLHDVPQPVCHRVTTVTESLLRRSAESVRFRR